MTRSALMLLCTPLAWWPVQDTTAGSVKFQAVCYHPSHVIGWQGPLRPTLIAADRDRAIHAERYKHAPRVATVPVPEADRFGVSRELITGSIVRAGQAKAGKPIPLEPGNGGRSVDARVLKPGDLIVSTTTDANSVAIRRATRSPVSHAALYVGKIGGVPRVVEATLAGVRRVPLSEALRDDSLAVALRHPRLDEAKAARLVDLARREVGKSYDGVGAAKQLLCRGLNRQCEVPLSTGGWYCSALLLYAFREAGAPLVTRPPTWRTPGDIASISVTGDLLYVGHLVTP